MSIRQHFPLTPFAFYSKVCFESIQFIFFQINTLNVPSTFKKLVINLKRLASGVFKIDARLSLFPDLKVTKIILSLKIIIRAYI